jgi:hypothetical protein
MSKAESADGSGRRTGPSTTTSPAPALYERLRSIDLDVKPRVGSTPIRDNGSGETPLRIPSKRRHEELSAITAAP